MKINLQEIPEEGRTYHFDRSTGELNEALVDLIENHPHNIELFIRPMGNAFEMTGKVQAKFNEVCSKCGWEIEVPIQRKINEILIEEQSSPRKFQNKHGNGSVDFTSDGPGVSHYAHDHFDVTGFVHEAVALAQPPYPSCGDDSCKNLAEVQAKARELELEFSAAADEYQENPFAVLKDLKNQKPN